MAIHATKPEKKLEVTEEDFSIEELMMEVSFES